MHGDEQIEEIENRIGQLMAVDLRARRMMREGRGVDERLIAASIYHAAQHKLEELSNRRAEMIVMQERMPSHAT